VDAGPVNADIDPDLARIIDAWPTLPEHIRAAVRALIDTAAAIGRIAGP
jgi:hypothetical protein